MKPLKKLLDRLSRSRQARPERRAVPEFVAYHNTGSAPKQENIKDISANGVYLLTKERWLPGTPVLLTIQRRGPLEENRENRVTLRAKSVRWGKDGVGLSFTLPKDLNFDLWERVLQAAADPREPVDILGPLRLAEATAFLTQICPSKADELRHLIRGGLGNLRVGNAVDIALHAESMLDQRPDSEQMRADAQIIFHILEDGSWADEEWIKQLWGGLLATSCSVDGKEETDTTLVDRFAQLAPVHVRLFKEACSRATKVNSDSGAVLSEPLICTVDELQKVTGSQSVAKIERDIHHLSALGLLEEGVRSRSLLPPQEANITPSTLGLTVFARCSGHRGEVEDFYFPAPGIRR